MKTTHTHKGVCQVCGNIHAVDNVKNTLAKHGYTVDWGFFNGECYGSHKKPLQLDRTLADETIRDCKRQITKYEKVLESNYSLQWRPKEIYGYVDADGKNDRYRRQYFHQYNAYKADKINYDNRTSNYYTDRFDSAGLKVVKYTVEQFQTLCENSEDENVKGYFRHNFAEIIRGFAESNIMTAKRKIKNFQDHIDFMEGQIERYYGKPLFDSHMANKVVKELTEEASKVIKEDKGIEEVRQLSNGRSVIRHTYDVWTSEASKEVNGRTLMIRCERNTRNYNGYIAYTFLDGKKISKKKLDEALF